MVCMCGPENSLEYCSYSSNTRKSLLFVAVYTKLADSGASRILLSPYLVFLWELWDYSPVLLCLDFHEF